LEQKNQEELKNLIISIVLDLKFIEGKDEADKIKI
jgi:hypothetical protein